MTNGNQAPTLGNVLGDIRLPGSDILKTAGGAVLTLLVLLLTTDNIIFRMGAECAPVIGLQRITLLLLGGSILFGTGSIAMLFIANITPIDRVRKYWRIYAPKLLLDCALLAFFSAVCLWVIGLGGITRSPFASLLCLSPAILLITCFRDRRERYDSVYDCVSGRLPAGVRPTEAQHVRVSRTMRAVGFLPVVVVLLTLSLGQSAVAEGSLQQLLLKGNLETVLQATWYFKIYYAIYFVSVGVAIYGGIPGDFTQRLFGP